MLIICKLFLLNGYEHRHGDFITGSGLKRSIIFILSFKKSSKKSRRYALYKIMMIWPFS